MKLRYLDFQTNYTGESGIERVQFSSGVHKLLNSRDVFVGYSQTQSFQTRASENDEKA